MGVGGFQRGWYSFGVGCFVVTKFLDTAVNGLEMRDEVNGINIVVFCTMMFERIDVLVMYLVDDDVVEELLGNCCVSVVGTDAVVVVTICLCNLGCSCWVGIWHGGD